MFDQATRARHSAPHQRNRRWFTRRPALLPSLELAEPATDTCVCLRRSEPSMGGRLRQRPGAAYGETLLGVDGEEVDALGEFRIGDDVLATAEADGIAAGAQGRISRIVLFRKSKPIGVRMAEGAWGPLVWFDVDELELAPDADTLVFPVPVIDSALEQSARVVEVEHVGPAAIGYWRPADDTSVIDAPAIDEMPLMGGAR